MDTITWWENTPETRLVFQKIVESSGRFDPKHQLNEWITDTGLATEQMALRQEFIYAPIFGYDLSRISVFQSYFDDPIILAHDTAKFSSGRHRTYRAWDCGLLALFVWVG